MGAETNEPMIKKNEMNSRQKVAARIRAERKELRELRNAVIMAHASCTGNYLHSDTEMKRRTGNRLAKAINKSRWCRNVLGYMNRLVPLVD